jgi:hypothetical protein
VSHCTLTLYIFLAATLKDRGGLSFSRRLKNLRKQTGRLGIVLPKRQSGLALGVLTVGDLAAAGDSALRQCWRFGGSRFDSAEEAAILIKVIQKSKIWNKMRDFVGVFSKNKIFVD